MNTLDEQAMGTLQWRHQAVSTQTHLINLSMLRVEQQDIMCS